MADTLGHAPFEKNICSLCAPRSVCFTVTQDIDRRHTGPSQASPIDAVIKRTTLWSSIQGATAPQLGSAACDAARVKLSRDTLSVFPSTLLIFIFMNYHTR